MNENMKKLLMNFGKLEIKEIDKEYIIEQNKIIKEKIELTKSEFSSISMSSQKFHKIYSL